MTPPRLAALELLLTAPRAIKSGPWPQPGAIAPIVANRLLRAGWATRLPVPPRAPRQIAITEAGRAAHAAHTAKAAAAVTLLGLTAVPRCAGCTRFDCPQCGAEGSEPR